jgi:general secretion pathway protein E
VTFSRRLCWPSLVAWGGLLVFGHAADVVFQNGQVSRGVKIVAETDTDFSLQMPEGVVKFPRKAIKSIDGRSVNEPPKPPAAPASAPAVPPVPAASPQPANPPTAAATQTPVPQKIAVPPPSPLPAKSPVKPALAPVEPESMPVPDLAALPAEPLIADPSAPKGPFQPASPPYEHRWNFEWLLLGLLLFAGVWMRSLQWVQRDLYERQGDPRFWSMVALFLPGLGAGLYALSAWIGDTLHRRRRRTQTPDSAPAGSPPTKAPWMPPPRDPAEYLSSRGATRKGFEFLDSERKSVQIANLGDSASGLDFASEMLEEALLEKASDIHIEPTPGDYRVRFRLDGLMHERMTYDLVNGKRLVTSLKTLAEIDIAEKRKAQDGRFRARAGGRDVDFRVATANSIHGEKVVIRVLDHGRGILDLSSLGMSDEMLANFQSVIHSRNGMILATGPTGSGKTSTLYAALRQLDATRMNIMTIEDPAEYELAGATQIAVNAKAGITYESGLRSILRQDPDVILVGEMRDTEATQVALRAALTGHLVLSSLHTKDAVGTISRLQDMGIERYQVASALLMIIAQRLVRVLCPHCREAVAAAGDELSSLGFDFEPGSPIYKPVGCPECLNTGFRGRTGIFELLVIDDEIRKAISEGAGEDALAELAAGKGFRTYRYDGAEKVLLGVTTVEEVLQAV